MGRVLVIGGYGNAGAAIVGLLLARSDHHVCVGGRHLHRAQAFVDELCAEEPDRLPRLDVVRVDAEDRASLDIALADVDLCIAAAGTSRSAGTAVAAALAAGVDYLDIQVGHAKAEQLLAMAAQARAAV